MAAEEKAAFVRKMDSGVGVKIGDVDFKVSGELNAFYVHDRPSQAPGGAIAGLADEAGFSNSSVREGLLPSNLNFTVSTVQHGLDITADFGFYPGINSQAVGVGGFYVQGGQTTGFGTPGIDMRQQFATIGNKKIGTFKIGRDIGLFGQEAILNDMTILAVGSPNGNVHPGSVSLGRIGIGYIYTDFIPQITYTTPSMAGLTAAFAVVQPFDDLFSTSLNAGLDTGLSAQLTGHGQPMFQAKIAYAIPTKGKVKANLWLNGITQSMQANTGQAIPGTPANPSGIAFANSVRGTGFDGGAKVTFGPASVVAYGYNCRGIGQEGLLFLAVDPSGRPRATKGGYVQGNFTLAKKTTFGYSYGESHVGLTPYDAINLPNMLKTNSSQVVQARYALTKWVTPIAEYTHTRSTAHNAFDVAGVKSGILTEDSIAIGAIVFF
jgi:predicted porin